MSPTSMPPLPYVCASQHASYSHGSVYYSNEEFADYNTPMNLTSAYGYSVNNWSTSDMMYPSLSSATSSPYDAHTTGYFAAASTTMSSPADSICSSPITHDATQLSSFSNSLTQALVDHPNYKHACTALNYPSPPSSTSGSSHSPSPPPAPSRSTKSSKSSKGNNGSGTKKCSHCSATSTPLWRRDPSTLAPLCNACGLYLQTRNKNRPQKLIDADNAEEPTEEELLAANWDGKSCAHCLTRCTSVWRRSKDGQPLCNACGVYLRLRGKERPLELRKNKFRPRQKHAPSSS